MTNKSYYHTQVYPDYLAKSINRLKDETNEDLNEIIRNHFGISIASASDFNVVVGWSPEESKYIAKKISIPRRFPANKSKATMEAYLLAEKVNNYLKQFNSNRKP